VTRLSSGPAKPETRRPRDPNNPRPGYYAFHFRVKDPNSGRYVKGPRLGARIWRPCMCGPSSAETFEEHDWRDGCDRFGPLTCDVDGVRQDPPVDRTHVPMLEKVNLYGEEITEAEYCYLVDGAAWDRENRPDAPAANPTKPIDLLKMNTPI
jgi:hypothetical protein